MFFCLEMHTNEAKGSKQSRIDPISSFAYKTADNCDNSYKSLKEDLGKSGMTE